jgi:hypothetical protein
MAITRNYDAEGNYVEQNDKKETQVVCVDGKRYKKVDKKEKK